MPLVQQSSSLPASEPRRTRRVLRLLAPALAPLLLFALCLESRAQQSSLGSPPRVGGSSEHEDLKQISSREEMLRNVAIRRREQAYKENIERAKESAALGAELRQAFERSKSLGAPEQKKLGRMEKLAKAIREQAGGDDDKEGLKEQPAGLEESLFQLEKLSGELHEKVEKTPRHVVSTAVISSANQLLQLIRHIRASFR